MGRRPAISTGHTGQHLRRYLQGEEEGEGRRKSEYQHKIDLDAPPSPSSAAKNFPCNAGQAPHPLLRQGCIGTGRGTLRSSPSYSVPDSPSQQEGNPLGAVLSGSSTQLPHRSERPGAWVPSPSTAALRSPCKALRCFLRNRSLRGIISTNGPPQPPPLTVTHGVIVLSDGRESGHVSDRVRRPHNAQGTRCCTADGRHEDER